MNLNKSQVNALATKIYEPLKTEYDKRFKTHCDSFVAIYDEKVSKEISDKVPEEFKESVAHAVERTASNINYSKRNAHNKSFDYKIPSIEEIEREIVIATIDWTSIKEIEEIIKKNLKLN